MHHPPPSATPLGGLVAAPVAGILALAALAFGAAVYAVSHTQVPVAPGMALAFLAASPWIVRAGRWRGGPRGGLVGASAMVPIAVFVWLGAAWALAEPLVSTHWRCGTGDIALLFITPPTLVTLGLVGAVAGLLLVRAPPGVDKALRVGAWAVLSLGAVLAMAASVRLAHHPAIDTYFPRTLRVAPDRAALVRHDGSNVQRWAFRRDTLVPCAVYVSDVARASAPPVGWVLGAWAGVALAFAWLLRGDKVLAPPAQRWHQGVHTGGGVVLLDDGSAPTHLPVGVNLPVGPVVMLPIMDARIAGYRDPTAKLPLIVVPGTVEDLVRAHGARAVTRTVLAIASVGLTSAPLLAAAVAGLVG